MWLPMTTTSSTDCQVLNSWSVPCSNSLKSAWSKAMGPRDWHWMLATKQITTTQWHLLQMKRVLTTHSLVYGTHFVSPGPALSECGPLSPFFRFCVNSGPVFLCLAALTRPECQLSNVPLSFLLECTTHGQQFLNNSYSFSGSFPSLTNLLDIVIDELTLT